MTENEQTIGRRFSLEEDFMNRGTDDLLYALLKVSATSREVTEEDNVQNKKIKRIEYLSISNYKKKKKEFQKILGLSTQTYKNHYNKLMERGLIKETVYIQRKGNKKYEYECIEFPYDYEGCFQIIDKEMLDYLINTRNPNCIRIYLYLLNGFIQKARENARFHRNDKFNFCLAQIKKELGYKDTSKTVNTAIKDILESMSRERIIDFETRSAAVNGRDCGATYDRYYLNFCTLSKEELDAQWSN